MKKIFSSKRDDYFCYRHLANLTFHDDHPVKGFVTKAGKSRFNEITKLRVTKPKTTLFSGKDTKGNLTRL